MQSQQCVSEPLTGSEMVERAQNLAPAFAARAARAEVERRLPQESVVDIVAAGFPAALVPREFGGHQLDLSTWMDMTVQVGRGCASTAWCVSLAVHYGLVVGMFPLPAQRAVWRDGPGTLFAAALFQRSGSVTAVAGGYLVSGEFGTASGVTYADWVIVGGKVQQDLSASGGRPDYRLFLIPPGSFSTRDDWFTAGMRGTGSQSVTVDDVFVPADHTLSTMNRARGTTPGGDIHGGMYRLPWPNYVGLTYVTPLLGAARGALDHFTSWITAKRTVTGAAVAEQQHIQTAVTEIDARLDAAELLMRRVVAVGDEHADGRPAEALQRRAHRDSCYSAQLITTSIEQLYRLGGSSVQAENNPIQRAWRDVHAGASHLSLGFDSMAVNYGRMRLGLPSLSGNPFV